MKLLFGYTILLAAKCYGQDQDATIKFQDINIIFKGMAIDSQAPINNYGDDSTKSFQAWIGYQLTPGVIHIQSDH